MANGIIPVTPGTGLNLQSYVNTVGGNSVHSEAVTLTDSSGNELGITANPVEVELPAAQIVALTPPTAADIGTAVASSLADPLPVTGIVTGAITAAVANAANPTFSEAAPAPLSVDLNGNLRSLSYLSDISGSNPAAPIGAIVSNGGGGPFFSFQVLASHAFSGPSGSTGLPFVLDMVGGTTNDMPVLFKSLPLGTGGRSVIIEGFTGGTPVPISGTITATITGPIAVTQSTSPWIVAGGGTAGAPGTAVLTVQGVSGGQAVPISGSVTIAANASVNLTQVAGAALGATAVTNFGTAPAAAAVPGINASLFAGTTGITATGSSINANVTNTVPVSGTIAVTQSTSPWVVSLTSTTITGTVSVTQGTSPWVVSNSGTFAVQATISAGAAIIGKVDILGNAGATLDSAAGTPNSQALTIQGNASGVAVPVSGTVTANAGTGTMSVQEVVGTTGGASTSFTNGTGGSTSISVKGSAGQIYGYYLDNTANAATTYFQFFNATSATLGSTAPTFVIPVPGGGCANLWMASGIAFVTGIRVGAATTYNGGTAVGAAVNITVWYD